MSICLNSVRSKNKNSSIPIECLVSCVCPSCLLECGHPLVVTILWLKTYNVQWLMPPVAVNDILEVLFTMESAINCSASHLTTDTRQKPLIENSQHNFPFTYPLKLTNASFLVKPSMQSAVLNFKKESK